MKPYEYGISVDEKELDRTCRALASHGLHEGNIVDALEALCTADLHEPNSDLLLSRDDMAGMVRTLLNGSVTNPRVRHILERLGVPQTAMSLETRAKMQRNMA